MHTEFWWGNHLEDLGVDGKIIFKRIFKIEHGEAKTEFI